MTTLLSNEQQNNQYSPFLMGDLDPPSHTPFVWLIPLTIPNGSSIASHGFTELCHKFFIHYNGSPIMHLQHCPLSMERLGPPFNGCFFLDQPNPLQQMAFQLPQPFFQNTRSFSTGRQTDRPTERSRNSAYTNS